jgi:hypothetical protein
MMILKDNKYDYYLCNESNFLYLESSYIKKGRWGWWQEDDPVTYTEIYETLQGYELGSYEFLFEEAEWFRHALINGRVSGITPTEEFFKNYKAIAREIKINNILNDLFDD